MTAHTYLARIMREEPVDGIVTVTLTLIRDEDVVELAEGDEFVTVSMVVDPWAKGPTGSGASPA